MRVAIVGTGYMARVHARVVWELGGTVVGVAAGRLHRRPPSVVAMLMRTFRLCSLSSARVMSFLPAGHTEGYLDAFRNVGQAPGVAWRRAKANFLLSLTV